jgi:hypothetical protein
MIRKILYCRQSPYPELFHQQRVGTGRREAQDCLSLPNEANVLPKTDPIRSDARIQGRRHAKRAA